MPSFRSKQTTLMGIGLALLLSGNVSNAIPVTNGLVGYWPADDTTADDFSGSGNHGTFVGNATTTTNVAPCVEATQTNAFEFDGTDDWISISGTNFPGGADPEMTVSFWVNIRTRPQNLNDNEFFVGLGTATSGGQVLIGGRNQGDASISHSNASDWVSTTTLLPLNTWVYYTYTASNGTDRIYTNGTLSDLDATSSFTPSYNGNSKLGSDAGKPAGLGV